MHCVRCPEIVHGHRVHVLHLVRFNKAAEHGDPKAQFNIAVMHEDGEGAERDPALALKWYTKSAESGYKRPCYELGRIYENAECGVEKVCVCRMCVPS